MRLHWLSASAAGVVAGAVAAPLLYAIWSHCVHDWLHLTHRSLLYTLLLCLRLALSPAIALGVFLFLSGIPRHEIADRETRCRKCGYILRGISEARCPECGERI